LYDPSGVEKGFGRGQASDRGSFVVTLQDTQGQPIPVESGDRLELRVDDDIVLTAEVPTLSVHMTVGGYEVTGTGPALQEVEVQLYRNRGWGDSKRVTTDAAGHYTVEFEGPALAPGDYVLVYATDADGNRTFDRTNSLWMSLEIDSHHVSGRAELGTGVTVMVRDGSGVARAMAVTTASRDSGSFDVALYDGGQPVLISAGDQVEITADDGSRIQVVVPRLTLIPDPEADVVTGVGPAGSVVQVALLSAMRRDSYPYRRGAFADETGHYAVSLGPSGNVRYGDSVYVSYVSPEGFPIARRYTLPWLNVELNTQHITGRVPYSATLTIELTSASGEERASAEVPTNSTGAFDAYLLDRTGRPAIVQTGDMVRLIMAGVAPIQFVVPGLTASADPPAAAVGGSAAPGSPVRVDLRSGGCTYTQEVLTDDRGTFRAHFDPIAHPTLGDDGFVYWNSPDGHAVFTRYEIARYRIFLPLLSREVTR
jgi:hypothetical protein